MTAPTDDAERRAADIKAELRFRKMRAKQQAYRARRCSKCGIHPDEVVQKFVAS